LRTPCRAKIKNQKIMELIGEKHNGVIESPEGSISTESGRNLAVNVNQVAIRVVFPLTGANGKTLLRAHAENASYAGHDTAGKPMA